jgi:hypothetical protein
MQHPGQAADPRPRLAHQAEAEIVRRHAGRTAAGAGIADEVGDIGAVLTLDDANAAIRCARYGLSGIVKPVAREAGRGPFPDVTGDVDEALLVDAEAAVSARLGAGDTLGLSQVIVFSGSESPTAPSPAAPP